MKKDNRHDLEFLPSNIKHYREKKKMTKKQLCEETGLDQSWLSKAEKAEWIDLKLSSAMLICEALEISLNDLVYEL